MEFTQEQRIDALAEYLDIDASEITPGYRENIFEVTNGEEYWVLTEEEAYKAEEEDIKELIYDLGIFNLFDEPFISWIEDNALDRKWFEDALKEDMHYYANDIEDEQSEQFSDRLTEEMFEEGILTDDDFMTVDETIEKGLVSAEGQYDPNAIDYKWLKDDIDFDTKKEEFIDKKVEDAGDPIDYFRWNFGDEEIDNLIKQNEYIVDIDKVVEECISLDGVGHNIASYDGAEIDLENGLFAYRIN